MIINTFKRNPKLIQQKYREYLFTSVMTSSALALADIVDNAMIGNLLGSDELAAFGACSPVVLIVNALFYLLATGGSAKAAIALGERKKNAANTFFTLSILFGIPVLLLLSFIAELFAGPISLLLSGNDSLLAAMVCDYYRPIVFVCPALLASLGTAQFMMIEGYARAASIIALVSNGINLVLDYVLIRYAGMGLTGAALSTVLGYVGGTMLVVPWLLSKKKSFRYTSPFRNGITGYVTEILSAGTPHFLMYLSVFINRVIMNAILLHYMRNIGLSVFAMCNSLIFLATSINNGSSNAFLPIAGSLYGERDYFGIRQCVKSAMAFILCSNAFFTLFMLFTPYLIASIFGFTSTDRVYIAVIAVRLLAIAVPFKGINSVLQGLYNSTDRSRLASAISVLSGVVYTSGFALMLTVINTSLFWLAFACSEFFTLLTAVVIVGIIKRKEPISGFLLLKPLPEGTILEGFTLYANKGSAAALSQQIAKIGKAMGLDSKLSNKISVAVEEMTIAVYESARNGKPPLLDVTLIKNTDDITLSFRENGKPCNLLLDDPEHPRERGDGIRVFTEVAKSTEYSHQLGFNTIIAKF